METQLKVDLTDFRLETRKWLEENCPMSMRGPVTDAKQLYWGGRNGKLHVLCLMPLIPFCFA